MAEEIITAIKTAKTITAANIAEDTVAGCAGSLQSFDDIMANIAEDTVAGGKS